MVPTIPQHATMGEVYGPAMEITKQKEADEYFEGIVFCLVSCGRSRRVAEAMVKHNLGYYAGYYDDETRKRVERLFHCSHPIFGSVVEKGSPTPEEAFEMGKKTGEKR